MSGNSVILDTNVIVRHFREQGVMQDHLLAHDLFVPCTVVGELYAGAHRSARPDVHCEKIETFLSAVTVLTHDLQSAKVYGKLWAHLAAAGQMVPLNDVWIAAIAMQYQMPLVTEDNHFSRVPDLEIIRW